MCEMDEQALLELWWSYRLGFLPVQWQLQRCACLVPNHSGCFLFVLLLDHLGLIFATMFTMMLTCAGSQLPVWWITAPPKPGWVNGSEPPVEMFAFLFPILSQNITNITLFHHHRHIYYCLVTAVTCILQNPLWKKGAQEALLTHAILKITILGFFHQPPQNICRKRNKMKRINTHKQKNPTQLKIFFHSNSPIMSVPYLLPVSSAVKTTSLCKQTTSPSSIELVSCRLCNCIFLLFSSKS